MYSEYLDSSSIDNKETSIKFSYEIKKDQINGIKKNMRKNSHKKKKIIRITNGKKIFFHSCKEQVKKTILIDI